jgi:hypothetical protein
MIADRCRNPSADLLSQLIQLEADGEELTVDDLRAIVTAVSLPGQLAPRLLWLPLVDATRTPALPFCLLGWLGLLVVPPAARR